MIVLFNALVLIEITQFYQPTTRLTHKWNEPYLWYLPLLSSHTASLHIGRHLFPILLRAGGCVGLRLARYILRQYTWKWSPISVLIIEPGFYICDRPLTDKNMRATFRALSAEKIVIFAVLKTHLSQFCFCYTSGIIWYEMHPGSDILWWVQDKQAHNGKRSVARRSCWFCWAAGTVVTSRLWHRIWTCPLQLCATFTHEGTVNWLPTFIASFFLFVMVRLSFPDQRLTLEMYSEYNNNNNNNRFTAL